MIRLELLPEHRLADDLDGGYLYVIALSSGLVKVGRSRNPRSRIDSHARNAAHHGAEISDLWLSPRHDNYEKNESRLIRLLGSATVGNEYFNVPFLAAVQAAESLSLLVMTDAERTNAKQQRKKRAEAFARSMLDYPQDKVSVRVPAEFPIGWILQLLFADELPAALAIDGSDELTEAVDLVAESCGLPREEVLAWSYLDVVQHIATTAIRIQRLEMQARAIKAGREDLTDSGYWGSAVVNSNA